MSIDRMTQAVKSVCEKDPGWWIRRRLTVMSRQSDVNAAIKLRPLPRRQRVDSVLAPPDSTPELGVRVIGRCPAIDTRVLKASGGRGGR